MSLPLAIIFNLSLKRGVFPLAWKIASVTPVFKKGARDDIVNYRGISKLSCAPKLFESLVNTSLWSHVADVMPDAQHGFVKGRSCTSNLVSFTSSIASLLEQPDVKQVDVIYTDFKQAFDRVKFAVIIKALMSYGVAGSVLGWFHSYLVDRHQFVAIKGRRSANFAVSSGVPQGSHVGPTLFILMMNFVVFVLEGVSFVIYADDLKIYYPIRNQDDCLFLQSVLDKFTVWCKGMGLDLSFGKCRVMTMSRARSPFSFDYSLSRIPLTRVHQMTDLGIIFNTKFDFNDDLSVRISKAKSMLGFVMRQANEFRDPRVLLCLYFAFVRSVLEYCCVVVSPHYQHYVTIIEKIQKRFLRLVLRDHANLTYDQMCQSFDLETLDKRRSMASVMFAFDVLTSKVDCPDILAKLNFHCPVIQTRRARFFVDTIRHTNYTNNEPINRMMRCFNSISQHFDLNVGRLDFKNRLRKFL